MNKLVVSLNVCLTNNVPLNVSLSIFKFSLVGIIQLFKCVL